LTLLPLAFILRESVIKEVNVHMAFYGKIALVTGGASGMGRLAALRLAKQGAKVVIVDLNEEGLAETAKQSDNITPMKCDVSDLPAVAAMVAEVEFSVGAIDRLCHCAGIMPGQSLKEMSAERINHLMMVNYCGTVNVVKTLMPLMEQRGSGDIIMFGSMVGDVLIHHLGAYCATKSATNSFAEVLIHENPDSPLRMLLVCPPQVDTPLLKQAMVEGGPASMKDPKNKDRLARPEAIIDAMEAAIEKGKWVVRPEGAAFLVLWRRLFPALLWKLMAKANQQ
jgi:NAD(P)-dependent dehydrogenase (short-subunit alcohol dehydrogenase family)